MLHRTKAANLKADDRYYFFCTSPIMSLCCEVRGKTKVNGNAPNYNFLYNCTSCDKCGD